MLKTVNSDMMYNWIGSRTSIKAAAADRQCGRSTSSSRQAMTRDEIRTFICSSAMTAAVTVLSRHATATAAGGSATPDTYIAYF